MSKQKDFPKPSKQLQRLNENHRNLIKLNQKTTPNKGKTGIQIINEFLNKAING